jgi:D-3-phosphoglycerate dehydrogenase
MVKMSPTFRIVTTESFEPAALDRLKAVGVVSRIESVDEAALIHAVVDADALLVRTQTQVTRRVIEAGRQLRVIGRAGSGLDNIDLPAARERGVRVVFTPEASTDAVADLTVGLMIGLLRKIADGDRGVRTGSFTEARRGCVGRELRELTLGIVGMGRIGRAVARRCHLGFGMSVGYNDIREVGVREFPAQSFSKPDLYACADIVSLHVPLTDQTRGMVDANALRHFKKGAALINTARGAIVDSIALAAALSKGLLRGAALDVTDPEPLPPGHPLLAAPNTVFTPHIGARTPSSLARMEDVVEDVIAVLEGRDPRHAAE